MRVLAVTALCAAAMATSAAADTVLLGASKDNTLYQNAPSTSNGAGEHLFAGQAGSAVNPVRRGLLAFDVSSIPAGSTINAVALTLNMSRTSAGVETINLHRVLSDWGEGTSVGSMGEGGGAAATANDATWEYTFFNTASWTNDGGDFLPLASTSQSVGGIGVYVFPSTADLVSDVQHWVDNPGENFGWILLGDEVGAPPTSKRFDSKDNLVPSNRPVLQVDYTPPVVAVDGSALAVGRLELLPVSPNPAFATTTFRFRLAESGPVRLQVYDAHGRRVADLAGGRFPAGESAVRWNAAGVPRGTYWVRVQADGIAATRSFALTRSR